MARTLYPPYKKLEQLKDDRKKYALEMFCGKVTDIFLFIELRAMPELKNGKNIIDNVLKLNMEINTFIETLSFLKEENCITIIKNQTKQQVKYFDKTDGLKEVNIFNNPEYKDLPYLDIKVNKKNFRKLIKRDFCTKGYFFEKNKDKKSMFYSKYTLIVGIIAIIVAILCARYC